VLIEYAMYFALGFLIAGLLMLMAMPAFWRRAMRLSMRRLQLLAPLSREDAIAERDLLRAEFAVKERQLEQRMAGFNADRTAAMLEAGRRAARIADLEDQLQRSLAHGCDLERQLDELRATLAERSALLSSTEQALREATEGAADDALRQRELRALHEERIADLHQLNTDLRREYAQLGEEFAHLSAEAERLAGVEGVLARTSSDLESVRADKLSLETTYATLRSSSELERERFIAEITHLENALRQTRAEARSNADRLEALRADHAVLQGSAAALRRDYADRRSQAANGGADAPPDARELAALRREIAELGASLAQEQTQKLRDTASA
jgi:chromosome segregation ATPase